MNSLEYERVKKCPLFNPAEHIVEIPIESLVFDRLNSQVRKDGNVLRKVPEIADSLENHGQHTPISIIPNCPRPGQNYLKDGTTRVLGKEKNASRTITASTYHAKVSFKNEEKDSAKWYMKQCQWNAEHLPCTPSTTGDINHQIEHMFTQGILSGLLGRPFSMGFTEEEKTAWIEESLVHLRETYPGKGKDKLQKILKSVLNSNVPNELFCNYTHTADVEFFNRINPFCAAGSSVSGAGTTYRADNGDIHAYYRATTPGHIEKEVLSYSYRKKMAMPDIKVTVAIHHSDIIKSDSKGIEGYIEKLVNSARKLNDAGGFSIHGGKQKVIDYLVVYPQIFNKDDMHRAKEVITL